MIFEPLRKHLWVSTAWYGDSVTFLYEDVDHASQETPVYLHLLLGDGYTFLYVDDVHTSQEAHLWASTDYYGDSVTFKNGVFRDVTPCGSCKNRRFGGTWRLLHQGDKNR
jgi:hypothetical protein